MSLKQSYHGAPFVNKEAGEYLMPWNHKACGDRKTGMLERMSDKSLWYLGRFRHHVEDCEDGVIAYIDWLIHRNPRRAYIFRRVALPCGLLIRLMSELLERQRLFIDRLDSIPSSLLDITASTQQAHLMLLRKERLKGSLNIPAMRVFRIHSTMIKLRKSLIERAVEHASDDDFPDDLVAVHITPWTLLGPSRWLFAEALKRLCSEQEKLETSLSRIRIS